MEHSSDSPIRTPSPDQQAKVDAFCGACSDCHNDQARCRMQSYPNTAKLQPFSLFSYTDQVRYALSGWCGSMAHIGDTYGNMDEKGFHPFEKKN